MKVIIDRFEGEFAVVEIETGKCINIFCTVILTSFTFLNK